VNYSSGPFEIDAVDEGGTFYAYLDPSKLGNYRIAEQHPDFRVVGTHTGGATWALEVLGPSNDWLQITPALDSGDLVVWGRAESWVVDVSAGSQTRIAAFRARRMRVAWTGGATDQKAHVELNARSYAG